MSSKSAQLKQKTLKKLETSLSNKDYYQSHQIIRTLVNRALTKKNYNEAIELLNTGINELLTHGQWSSVTDLSLYLIKVFEMKGNSVDEENIGNL
jgi:ribonucleotide monophosphatase NagD (HAD superfamily)